MSSAGADRFRTKRVRRRNGPPRRPSEALASRWRRQSAATLRDRAQAEVTQADGGYAGAWQAARDAGWTPALLRGMGYPQPAATRPARLPANSATAADPSLATAAGGATRTSSAGWRVTVLVAAVVVGAFGAGGRFSRWRGWLDGGRRHRRPARTLLTAEWHTDGMNRTRLSTTVDPELLDSARRVSSGVTDAALIDEALRALLVRHRSAEVDASYAAYDEHPADEPDEWGDLASWRHAAAAS